MDKVWSALQNIDKDWAATASRQDLLMGLEEAGRAQRRLDLVNCLIRAELARRREPGCGHDAADEIAAEQAAGVPRRIGRRDERRAMVTEALGAAGVALADGLISGGHLDAVADVVPEELMDAVAKHQDDLFDQAQTMSPDRFRRRLSAFAKDVRRQRGIDRSGRQRVERRGRCHTVGRTGMIELHAELDPVRGAHVQTRVRTEYRRLLRLDQRAPDPSTTDPEADSNRTVEQRWADAITNVICSGGSAGPVDDRLPVVVVDRSVLEARTDDGHCEISGADTLPADCARYMACDRPILALSLDPNGKPIALTHFNRHASAPQRQALAAVWGTCVGPDCDVAFSDCHIHHTIAWSTRPVTALHELAPVCSRHHHLVHEGRWGLTHLADHTIEWTSPGGETYRRRPRPGFDADRERPRPIGGRSGHVPARRGRQAGD